MAGHPVTMFSSIHCAAATENFLVMEHHNPDDAWYEQIVDGPEKPFAKNGFVPVPNTPGLGVELNEDAIKSMIRNPEQDFFAPTDEWNNERSHDRLWRHVHRQEGSLTVSLKCTHPLNAKTGKYRFSEGVSIVLCLIIA